MVTQNDGREKPLAKQIKEVYAAIKKEKGRNPYIAEVMEKVTLDKSKTLNNKRVNIKEVLKRADLELTPGMTTTSKKVQIQKRAESIKEGSRIERVLPDNKKAELFEDIRTYRKGVSKGPDATMNIREFAKYFPDGTSEVVISRQVNRVANDILKLPDHPKKTPQALLDARKVKYDILKEGDQKNIFQKIPKEPGKHRHHMRAKGIKLGDKIIAISPSLGDISQLDAETNSVKLQESGYEKTRNDLAEELLTLRENKPEGWHRRRKEINALAKRESNKIPKHLRPYLFFETMNEAGDLKPIGGWRTKSIGGLSPDAQISFNVLAKIYEKPDFKVIMEETMNETAGRKICRDGCFIKVGKQNPGLLQRTLQKLAGKGGRLGAIFAGAGAVGAGTWAMMGGAEAEEAGTTEQMTYNSITGEFDDAEGEPETQEGILNWIADHPAYSGVAPVPVGIGLGLGAEQMNAKNVGNFFKSMKFMLPPAYAAEKLHQYKRGDDMGQMFANPIDAVWAMALDTKDSRNIKWEHYKNLAKTRPGWGAAAATKAGEKAAIEAEQLGLHPRTWKNIGKATMAPASRGTRLVFPFATENYGFGKPITEGWRALAPSGIKRGLGMAARLAPLGPIPMALLAGEMAWDKYKFNKEISNHIDALRARGVVSEEDAQSMNTIYKQGWLGTTAIGAKILGSEELMLDGELADIDRQKEVLAEMKTFYEKEEKKGKDFRAGERQEDFFSWFSGGGRVGLAEGGNKKPFGSMTRRSFLKWLVGSIAAGTAALTGRGLKQAAKTITPTVTKAVPAKFAGFEGMPLWFPRAVAKIKTHGKLLEMADKHYTQGDIYEMMIPVKVPKFDRVAGKEVPSGFETQLKKVTMEENPLSGEINLHWTGTDNFGDDAIREINFKPGEAGYQKFGVDPEHPTAWEYQRVKVDDPEFSYTQPDQSNPYRDDIEYLDIFEEGDEVVKGLEDMTGGKKMVAKDGSVIDVSAEGKGVDEAFQKKLYRDAQGEDALVPDAEGQMGPEGDWLGDSPNPQIEGDVPDWVPRDKMWTPDKKAEGGRVGYSLGTTLRKKPKRQLTEEEKKKLKEKLPSSEEIKEYLPKEFLQKRAEGGTVETGNIARRPGAVPPLSGPNPQGTGIVGLFSSPKRVNVI